jgi:ABC-type sugar transport system ATPase subunit
MVFQDLALYPHMTAAQNIAFPLEAKRGRSKEEIRRQVEDKADMVGIGHLLQRRIGQLSGGQRQRVALARALVREPIAFLMDEAFSSLDAILRREFRAEFKRFQRRLGVTMVHVTHDQEEAMTMGDRICVFSQGRLVQVGSPIDLFLDPSSLFVARFVGSPPMNLLPCTVERADGALSLRGDAWSLPLPPAMAERVEAGARRRHGLDPGNPPPAPEVEPRPLVRHQPGDGRRCHRADRHRGDRPLPARRW